MPINVFGNTNHKTNKIDTSLFVQKSYLRTSFSESNIEEDIDLKIHFRIKNLQDPFIIREPASKKYVDNKFNDPGKIKNTEHIIDLNDKNITNARFFQISQLPQIDCHSTPKFCVDNSMKELLLVRNIKDNDS